MVLQFKRQHHCFKWHRPSAFIPCSAALLRCAMASGKLFASTRTLKCSRFFRNLSLDISFWPLLKHVFPQHVQMVCFCMYVGNSEKISAPVCWGYFKRVCFSIQSLHVETNREKQNKRYIDPSFPSMHSKYVRLNWNQRISTTKLPLQVQTLSHLIVISIICPQFQEG